jgi:saccharopine dehydrogenase-like NADP-dependent oxidoreductase
MKHVLMLGAGLVSGPMARYLLALGGLRLTVASLHEDDARALIGDHPNGTARAINVADENDLDRLMHDADLVVSLVPFTHHVTVARLAIKNRLPMITTSYVAPEMGALDGAAREAGILVLNECGLDPGIDHMSASRTIHRLQDSGTRITGFFSVCGGLPAPEAANNPWRYKFSWSPRGALLAGLRPARYLHREQVRHIPHEALFSHFERTTIEGVGEFEVYPNGDALRYVSLYELDDLHEMFRGTLRYPGWCAAMGALARLGLLDLTPRRWPAGTTFARFLDEFVPAGDGSLERRLQRHLGLADGHDVLTRFRWAGLVSDAPIPAGAHTPIDVLAERFQQLLRYEDGERDMVVLQHRFDAVEESGVGLRVRSTLVSYGEPGGDSATARTVSLPAAVATRLVLEGRIRETGVHVPVFSAAYEPILDELERLGIAFEERIEPA